ncbi:MAG: SDH family Clp fold serine proteinase [Candidatus Udaeobacter sp.]
MERELKIPIWFVIQNERIIDDRGREDPFCNISLRLFKAFQEARDEIPEGKPVGLLLESPGGDAHAAFRISRMLQRRSNNFTVIIAQWAKSAATLLALGAHTLLVARQAELGPLDVQMFDPHKEELGSALNAVQSLERLNAFAMTAVDQMMILIATRFGRKLDVSLPLVLDYATKFTRPLLEKIDTVDYVRKSRELKVAEDYATRLMMPHYPISQAKDIARKLVQMYPTHGFVIDRDEAASPPRPGAAYGLGLKLTTPSVKAEGIMRNLVPFLDSLNASGRVKEIKV